MAEQVTHRPVTSKTSNQITKTQGYITVDDEPEQKEEADAVKTVDIDDATAPIVMDNGSYGIFAGLGGYERPEYGQLSIVGSLRDKQYQMGHSNVMDGADTFITHNAFKKKGILSVKYPIQRGRITDWNRMVCLRSVSIALHSFE